MKNYGLVLIAIILIAITFGGPLFISALSKGWKDFWSNVWKPFGDSESNATASGGLGLGMTIVYEDGEKDEFEPPTEFPFSIISLTAGKAMSYLTLHLSINPTYTGEITSYTITTNWVVELTDYASNPPTPFRKEIENQPLTISKSGTIPSGKWTKIWDTRQYMASEIESWYTYENSKTYSIIFRGSNPSVTLKFSDGSELNKVANSLIKDSFEFRYQSPATFTAISTSLYKTVY